MDPMGRLLFFSFWGEMIKGSKNVLFPHPLIKGWYDSYICVFSLWILCLLPLYPHQLLSVPSHVRWAVSDLFGNGSKGSHWHYQAMGHAWNLAILVLSLFFFLFFTRTLISDIFSAAVLLNLDRASEKGFGIGLFFFFCLWEIGDFIFH